ncbi:Fe-S cluster assembly protein SufD [Boudabousia marimammalium]|uniref:Fe-S cluster assembly protein SufD n=1 Tax=Boudabousia marimammalium TaxID=156892 RepID=A0A1Q5PR56_9ACTO|nr:Fe-S cluster assembly protein SufD [Boudabousia marimammalium]
MARPQQKPVKPSGSRAERPTSFSSADFPLPTGREEEWRFTPMKRIRPLMEENYEGEVPAAQIQAPDDVSVSYLDCSHAPQLALAGGPQDRTSALAWENWKETMMIEVPARTELDTPVIVKMTGTHERPAAGSTLIHVKEQSSAIVVLEHYGHALYNETVQIIADAGSKVTVVTTQEWDESSIHAANYRITAAKDAEVKHIVVTLGGDLVRICTDARFSEPGANVELLGLYFTDAGQHHEHRLFVDHSKPNCVSRVTYKGALQGKNAHAVWVGDVLIGKEGFGTDTYELNRNLVLSEGARADSVPNLEIENGEIVGAGHASATGRFDDEQLFYLRARGIPEVDARRLVVLGFFGELINQIGVPEVDEHLMEKIEEELMMTGQIAAGTV